MGTVARLTRGLGASIVLLALVVGVPVFLAFAVGWPLPRAVPAWADVRDTFTGDVPLDPDTVWKILAVVVWIAWAQLAVAAVVEVVALARGGIASPIRGLAHMQGLTGPLLSAAALLLPSSVGHSSSNATVPAPSMARTLVAHVTAELAPPANPAPGVPPGPTIEVEATTFEYRVQRRDTLWDLAERYLAPGGSTEEVAAAVGRLYDLNAGHPQPDGATLTDAGLLRPGWVLRIPTADASTPVSAHPPAEVTVVPGDSLWEIAEDHLGDGHRYRELYDLNAGDPQPDGRTLTNPSLVRPGWTIELPAAAAPSTAQPPVVAPAPPAPVEPPKTSTTAAPTTTAPTTVPSAPADTTPPQEAGGHAEDDGDESGVPARALGAAAGLLSVGLLGAVTARRRRRRAERQPGTELPPLPSEAEPILDAIAEADVDLGTAIGHTLRQLGSALAERATVPVPIVGTVNGPHLELLLDRHDPHPPDGWSLDADGRIWRTQPQGSAGDGAGPGWLPTLVTVGAVDDGGMLLNLEAHGAVGLTGTADAVTALALSVAVELGVTELADMPAVHAVGNVLGIDCLDALPGIHHHTDLASALAAADQTTAGIASALSDTGAETVFELRCRAPEEAWAPAVVIVDADTEPDALGQLLARATTGTGVVAVVAGACPSGVLELSVSPDIVTCPALGLSCTPQRLDISSVNAIAALLDAADEPCQPPAADGPLTLFADTDLDTDSDGAAPKMHLRLLGPITVEGAELRPQQLALLAYLALHPDVTADAVRDAVWGGRAPTRERFLNTIHELRRAVGTDVLPTSTDGRYRLRRVWCDVIELEQLVASAAAQSDDATADLRAALELVTGPPLTFESRHRRHFKWIDLGNHASRWERIAGDAAHDLASIALDADDVDLARWAAERGLAASPASETLTRDLVLAHLAAGDRNAAEHVVEAYARVLEDMGSDEPTDALVELLEDKRAS
ncbi:MAG: LysM peptidoglycan-binding domain-containing protein [Acidimicrobiia bacterium]